MASEALTFELDQWDLPSTTANVSEASYLQSRQAVSTLPTLLVTSPEGYVHEILPPVRRTAVRLSPAAIRRLQAARHAESPLGAATLLHKQEEPVAEVQKPLSLSRIWDSLMRLFTSKLERRQANPPKRRPEQRRSELL